VSTLRTVALRVATVSALCAVASVSEAQAIECPASIPVQESVAPAAVQPWLVYDTKEGPYNFYGVTFSDGPPQNRLFLAPSKAIRSKSSRQEIYDFKSAQVTAVWLLCLYRDTSIAISRKLEGSVARCRVTYDPKTQFRSVKAVDCE
jgi:hypothetical protein